MTTTTTTELGLRIREALLNVRAARLARGPHGESLSARQVEARVDAANDQLNAVLDEVHRN